MKLQLDESQLMLKNLLYDNSSLLFQLGELGYLDNFLQHLHNYQWDLQKIQVQAQEPNHTSEYDSTLHYGQSHEQQQKDSMCMMGLEN